MNNSSTPCPVCYDKEMWVGMRQTGGMKQLLLPETKSGQGKKFFFFAQRNVEHNEVNNALILRL